MKISTKFGATVALVGALSSGCGQPTATESQILVSDVEHTRVKRQSIGNCWLYAVATWAESLHLAETDEEINISETYWTYWHFYNQLVRSSASEISTGGNWWVAGDIIEGHGYMIEGDFVPGEADLEMSAVQAQAEQAVNTALAAGGELADRTRRTPARVKRVLNRAFGVDIDSVASQVKHADELLVARTADRRDVTLADAIGTQPGIGWRSEFYPVVSGRNQAPTAAQTRDRKALLKRVMKAVNDYKPVIMSVYIDFNALDMQESAFKLETLQAAGGPGRQGGHMVVLEDYVVDNVPDGQGGTMTIGEGDVSSSLKEKALEGDVRYLKIKNSWGTNRADRGITDGYHKFYSDYLNKPWEVTSEQGGASRYNSALSLFILPPGY